MIKFIKYIWRRYHAFLLKKKSVFIASSARFNNNTKFEDHIKIHKGSNVGNSAIGRNTYVASNVYLPNCRIGRFCCIAHDVTVVPDTHPAKGYISSSPIFYSTKKQCGQSYVSTNSFEEESKVDGNYAIIGNDVWIGAWVKIKGGIRIGDGAIIAMGAIVTKDVPPYAVVGGVPAKIIRYRFSDDIILKLLEKKWWNKPDQWLRENAHLINNIETFLNLL